MSSVSPKDTEPRGRPVRAAYAWAAGGTFAAQGVLWLLSLVVMGILQPADYGLVGIINVFFSFCRTVQDAGLSTAIVQRPSVDRRLLSSAFWFFVATGVFLTLAGIGAAPIVAALKAEPRIPGLMRALAVNFTLLGIRTVPTSLLTKALDFRKRSVAEILGAATGALTTVSLALTHHGVWSLALGGIAAEAGTTLFTWRFARWTPAREFDWSDIKSLMRIGLPVSGAQLIWQFYIQSDFLMIGLLLGTQQLGWYTLAWQLAMVPVDRLTAVMNKANLPVFASMQSEPDRLRSHWHQVIGSIAWVTFPMAAGLALVGGDLIHSILPAKWSGAIPALTPLAILGGVRSIAIVLPNLLTAVGKPGRNLLFSCVAACVYPPVFAFAAKAGGIRAVGWAWVIVAPILMLFMVRLALRVTPLTLSDYFSPLAAPFASTAMMSILVWWLSNSLNVKPLTRLEILVAAGIFSYAAVAGLWFRTTGRYPWRPSVS